MSLFGDMQKSVFSWTCGNSAKSVAKQMVSDSPPAPGPVAADARRTGLRDPSAESVLPITSLSRRHARTQSGFNGPSVIAEPPRTLVKQCFHEIFTILARLLRRLWSRQAAGGQVPPAGHGSAAAPAVPSLAAHRLRGVGKTHLEPGSRLSEGGFSFCDQRRAENCGPPMDSSQFLDGASRGMRVFTCPIQRSCAVHCPVLQCSSSWLAAALLPMPC